MTMTQEKTEGDPRESRSLSRTASKKSKIGFFGIFGVQNLGNECTLQSILYNARERFPEGEIYSICYQPDDTSRRHNLPAVPISMRYFQSRANGKVVQRRGGLSRLARVIFKRIPGELMDWVKAVRTLRGTDLVVMTGTGMLTDYSTSAFGYPYDVFKWSAAARLAGCKLRFVGIGVGPIYGPLSRRFIRYALSLADCRSYRDEFSKNRIAKAGFDSSKDFVFPDLVFSLSKSSLPSRPNRISKKVVVGLGVMDHRDIHIATLEEQEASYSSYLDKMCEFVCWLVKNGYAIRILQGDVKYDAITRADLRARLEQRGVHYEQAGIFDEGSSTVEELIEQIAQVDIVVSPRFHNLLLGLMLNIPAVSISYDPKNDALLEGMGLGKYCQALTELDVKKLIEQFVELEARIDEVKPMISKRVIEYRGLLKKEYDLVFGDL
jgi:polysaccharide pyruvyl transferase WcaK-like protein